MPNFMGARIPVSGQFNITAWKSYLTEYWDKQIVDLLQYSFPLDFDRSRMPDNLYYVSFANLSPFEMLELVKESGSPNLMEASIPVMSPLKF